MSRLLVWAVCGSSVGHSFWRCSFIEPPRLIWALAAGLAAAASVGLAAGEAWAGAAWAAGAAGGGVGCAICWAGFGAAAASVGLAAAGALVAAGADGACCPQATSSPVP